MRKLLLLSLSITLLYSSYAQHTTLIKQVNIIDVEKGIVIKNANVLLRDSSIVNISTGKPNYTADAIIDGNNRFLIPGLWDMHVHLWTDSLLFPQLLANGITGVRDMFEVIESVHNWRKNIASGKMAGPQIIAAGPIVDDPNPFGLVRLQLQTQHRADGQLTR